MRGYTCAVVRGTGVGLGVYVQVRHYACIVLFSCWTRATSFCASSSAAGASRPRAHSCQVLPTQLLYVCPLSMGRDL